MQKTIKDKIGNKIYSNLKRIKSPAQIQTFINSIPFNHELAQESLSSPLVSINNNRAHCIEGALIASLLFEIQNKKSWLLDLKSTKDDMDHVVTIFKDGNYYGAVSKTNHSVLRYRDPIYKNIRELALSYFHEYYLNDGRKTLRSYSKLFPISKYDKTYNWIDTKEDLWELGAMLDDYPHVPFMAKEKIRTLRKADKIEIESTKMEEWENLKKHNDNV
jgi:hypothetical protein